MADAAKTLEEALAELARDRAKPVRAKVGALTVELRVVDEAESGQSAADVFESIGPWAGDDAEEIADAILESRHRGGNRPVPGL